MPKTPAELMGLGPAPTEREIRARFRELVLPLHPDHNPDDPGAVRKFHALVSLREVLLTRARLAPHSCDVFSASAALHRTATSAGVTLQHAERQEILGG
jgi:hypothetical protein